LYFSKLFANPNLSDGGANICNTYILKPLHKWNIISSRNYMRISWTLFFCISIAMAPQIYHEGIAKSRSTFIQSPPHYDWSIVCNTFIVRVWCCDEKYLKEEKIEENYVILPSEA